MLLPINQDAWNPSCEVILNCSSLMLEMNLMSCTDIFLPDTFLFFVFFFPPNDVFGMLPLVLTCNSY